MIDRGSSGRRDATSVALVVLDTLRKDAFDRHFDWLPGTHFSNAWSTSHWTVPAHASLFTGRYGSEVGIYAAAQTFDCPEALLAERLAGAGYTTRAFSANPNVSPAFDCDRGFDQFEGSWRLAGYGSNTFDWDGFIARTRDAGPERYVVALKKCLLGDYATIPSLKHGVKLKLRDLGYGRETSDDGAQAALEFVRDTHFGDREFLFVNLMEAHTPYKPPDPYRTVDVELHGLAATLDEPGDDPDDIRQAYDDCVRYLADAYRKLFAELAADFDLVVTVSDHGELLGEHGAWEHLYGIYPEVAHVPLSIYDPEKGVDDHTVESSVSLLDVHATILSAAGIEPDGRGVDLLTNHANRESLVEYHGISERRKRALADRGFTEIEFLETPLDGIVHGDYYGYETFFEGFVEVGESVLEDPQARLAEVVESMVRRERTEDGEVDEAVLGRLEDLGYA